MKTKITRIIIVLVALVVVVLMGFQLKKNKSEVAENVKIAQQTIDQIPVSVEKADKGILSEEVMVSGVLEAAESLNLMSETQGKIMQIFKHKGDMVRKGDLILKVDDEVIAANVLTAEANYEQFQKDVDRLTRLAEQNAVTKRDLEQTEIGLKKAEADLINARKALDNTAIKAPISGYVNDDYITVGQLLGGGAKVCEIVDNSYLKINVAVSEQQVYQINKGQKVEVFIPVFPDKVYSGVIKSIAEKANDAMKFNVEVILENKEKPFLKSGMFSQVQIPVTNQENILINRSAIVGSMKKPEVFIVENNKAVKREIVIGGSNAKNVEVLHGLVGNEKIIVSGQLNLNNGDDVLVIN